MRDFLGARPEGTDGHEEVEIALLRLYEVTGHRPYLDLARQFVENRGRIPHFWLSVLRQNASMQARRRAVERQRAAYQAAHPEYTQPPLPPENFAPRPPFSRLRWYLGALTGKYFQQHAPIRQQRVPVGHAVRFGYLMTAAAMLCRLGADGGLPTAMEAAWEHMVTQRMYVTGGLGALPDLEGFGRDYELHPEYAYAETCAALASLFWNWQMTLITGEARYADLLEWQLYNAALAGMGLNGDAYLYNNPLLCRGGVERRAWYAVPCCPSNLSRTLAWLGQYICSRDADTVWVHQYISGRVDLGDGWVLDVESGLPWQGQVRIRLEGNGPDRRALCLRVPSWAGATALRVNGAEVPADALPPAASAPPTACGYDPGRARSVRIDRRWAPGDELTVEFSQPIRLLRQDRRLPGCGGRVAVARGPLVYCLESVDNPGVDLFNVEVVPESLETVHDAEELGGMVMLRGMSVRGERLTFIPYMLWANRGPSQMTVFVGG
ncbi:MAG: glycoside hydrolase family 127 protein [Chloroflexi bacterium]|nr:glycoside hydrolase family 127 protein [Chloroflexota bacterium]